ncbi:M6 family metalloprotease domain-containing protein [Streptomyces chartreusis]|uniref:M6 family metalloprotease domain-containing protein n=1 Tax=Streptomyces chartreusis TaxID=1969 RepID=UPI002E18A2BA|nr:M6 family metalloprotease domain-containing protein [Streptomyces chartreusis]
MDRSEGLPTGEEFASSVGTVKVLTLLVDFSDHPAREAARARYQELVPATARWYAASSYGRLRYRDTPVLKWWRMPRPFTAYHLERGLTFEEHRAFLQDLADTVGHRIDFRGYEIVNVLATRSAMPPSGADATSTFSAARPQDGVRTAGGASLMNVVNIFGRDPAGFMTLVHETGHAFGLPDLYDAEDFDRTGQLTGPWDVMGVDGSPTPDFLAWHKWKLRWLDDRRIACVSRPGTSTHVLHPVGGHRATAVVVPGSPTGAFVLEARARRGLDRAGCAAGVLISWVDTGTDSGKGPISVYDAHPDTSCDRRGKDLYALSDAPYREGESLETTSGTRVTFTVLSAHRDGSYTVRVTRP